MHSKLQVFRRFYFKAANLGMMKLHFVYRKHGPYCNSLFDRALWGVCSFKTFQWHKYRWTCWKEQDTSSWASSSWRNAMAFWCFMDVLAAFTRLQQKCLSCLRYSYEDWPKRTSKRCSSDTSAHQRLRKKQSFLIISATLSSRRNNPTSKSKLHARNATSKQEKEELNKFSGPDKLKVNITLWILEESTILYMQAVLHLLIRGMKHITGTG